MEYIVKSYFLLPSGRICYYFNKKTGVHNHKMNEGTIERHKKNGLAMYL